MAAVRHSHQSKKKWQVGFYRISKLQHLLSCGNICSNCQICLLLSHQFKELLSKGTLCELCSLLKGESASNQISEHITLLRGQDNTQASCCIQDEKTASFLANASSLLCSLLQQTLHDPSQRVGKVCIHYCSNRESVLPCQTASDESPVGFWGGCGCFAGGALESLILLQEGFHRGLHLTAD